MLCYQSPDTQFRPQDLLEQHSNIGLVVDLTFTYKYYNGKDEFESRGVQYLKIMTQGGGQPPKKEDLDHFNLKVNEFWLRHPDKLIVVHCTHGINRTGYFIVTYLVDKCGMQVETALQHFSMARSPGIWDREYIEKLCRTYGAPLPPQEAIPAAPPWSRDHRTRNQDRTQAARGGGMAYDPARGPNGQPGPSSWPMGWSGGYAGPYEGRGFGDHGAYRDEWRREEQWEGKRSRHEGGWSAQGPQGHLPPRPPGYDDRRDGGQRGGYGRDRDWGWDGRPAVGGPPLNGGGWDHGGQQVGCGGYGGQGLHGDRLPAREPPRSQDWSRGERGGGGGSPYTQGRGSAYTQGGSPYTAQGGSPYTAQGGSPYTAQGGSPYTQGRGSPYTQSRGSPYLQGVSSYSQGGSPYTQGRGSPYTQGRSAEQSGSGRAGGGFDRFQQERWSAERQDRGGGFKRGREDW